MKVVFDTNVVASASFWRGKPFDCLVAWAKGRCEAGVSLPMLSEYFDTVEELQARYPTRECVLWAERLTGAAELLFPEERLRGATKDPDDEMFLECAVAFGADYLVSGDKAHVLSVKTFRGVRIVSCAQFLLALDAA